MLLLLGRMHSKHSKLRRMLSKQLRMACLQQPMAGLPSAASMAASQAATQQLLDLAAFPRQHQPGMLAGITVVLATPSHQRSRQLCDGMGPPDKQHNHAMNPNSSIVFLTWHVLKRARLCLGWTQVAALETAKMWQLPHISWAVMICHLSPESHQSGFRNSLPHFWALDQQHESTSITLQLCRVS